MMLFSSFKFSTKNPYRGVEGTIAFKRRSM